MSDLKPLFELEGRPVMRGQELHIAPSYHWRAGARAKVERFHSDEEVQLRSDNGAVPTVPVCALSWSAHPDTVAMEQMAEAGLGRASPRDLAVWKAARAQPAQAGQVLTDEEIDDVQRQTNAAYYAGTLQDRQHSRAIEQAVLAKRVPMTDDTALIRQLAVALDRCRFDSLNMSVADMRALSEARTAASKRLGIVGENGGA